MSVLRSVEPFSALNPSRLKHVLANAHGQTFERDQFLMSPGDHTQRVLLLGKGLVLVGVYTPEGAEVAFHTSGPGSLLGALQLLGFGSGPEHARALTSGVAFSLPSEVLREQAEQSPPFALALGRLAARDAIRVRQLLAESRFLDVAGRLARRLLGLADVFGVPAPEIPGRARLIDLRLRHQDLAVLAGATRESVSKAMSRFATEGWIRTESGRITLADEDAIRYTGWADVPEAGEGDAASHA